MPEPAAVDIELEQRVAELVAARRPLLEQLVRDAVDRELVQLVDRELDAAVRRLASRNGHAVATSARSPCSRCGERERLPGRTVCQSCRHARARERRAKPAASSDDGPRTGSTPPIR